ncbi:MAG TPA: 16S rRNA (guanine(527)-N(7))-methyltransferase RsmG [Steroidobacteraceae bacterium]|nr:16S rRNA (guanine(527)-N(7))-methyltransferase RsmG [Steroidobacteraceae bacterium]
MSDTPREVLTAGLRELGLELTPGQVGQLLALAELVREWNKKFNLTAIREPVAMVRKHLLDSLTVARFVAGATLIDVGSGAGFPGLPLAIADPDLAVTLVDSTAKKVRFLEHAIGALKLARVTAVHARAEAFRPDAPAATVVSRALGSLAEFVRVAGHLCARGGRLLAMKGKDPKDEVAALPKGWRVERIERLKVPGLADERHLVILAGRS